jgi:hypothetical protein
MVIVAKAAALIVVRSVRIFMLTFFLFGWRFIAPPYAVRVITPASWKSLKKLQAPAGKVDPPAGTGIMKPRVGCWQSKLDSGQGALIWCQSSRF